jgi:glycosyltransferase involved in cell wall biosynthesis
MDHAKLLADEKDDVVREIVPEKSVELSVVIPISEHHDDLRQLYLQNAQVLSAYGHSYEFIFVVDGPKYEALQALNELKKEYSQIKVIALNRSVGEATALSVGFDKAKRSIILTLAAYFQVEPHEVHKILGKLLEDGNDLVVSWRYPRIDSLFNRAQSWVFHWLTRKLTGTVYHDISCGLRAMKRRVAEEIQLYGDLEAFIPLLAYRRGFKIAEVPVQQYQHDVKRRMYGPGVYFRRMLDIMTIFFLFKFTKRPLRFFGLLGSGVFTAGVLVTSYLGIYRLLKLGPIAGRPLLILGVLLIVFGVQLFSLGLLGEIIIFTHSRKIKEYTIDKFLK